jgi:hypothetical protein
MFDLARALCPNLQQNGYLRQSELTQMKLHRAGIPVGLTVVHFTVLH